MPTELENLKRQDAVLREALEKATRAYWTRDAGATIDSRGLMLCVVALLAEADSIAAEPVEKTDADVVNGYLEAGECMRLTVGEDETPWFWSLAEAAAWVRAQGEVPRG